MHIFVKLYIRKILTKELSLRTNSDFLIPKSLQPNVVELFQTMNSVRSNNQSLKYQRCKLSVEKNIGIRTIQFVTKTHSHYTINICMYIFVCEYIFTNR